MKLTDASIAALKLDGKDRIVFDDSLVGFGYRMRDPHQEAAVIHAVSG